MADKPARFNRLGRKRWDNWHKSFRVPIADLFDVFNGPDKSSIAGYADTTAKLQEIIALAQTDKVTLRAVGSGWSLSKAATCDGYMLNTLNLNYRFNIKETALAAGSDHKADLLFFAQCGCSIAEINQALESSGRSLLTSGAANGQTIAGATSTNTHGSALQFGALHDHIVGLHMITGAGPNDSYWIERASDPVMSAKFAKDIGAELLRDDELFEAAVVSFGSFGILHGVMLKVGERFLLEAHSIKQPWTDELTTALDTGDFSKLPLPGKVGEKPYYFEATFNPYDGENAYLSVMYKRPDDGHKADYRVDPANRVGFEALNLVGILTDSIPPLTRVMVNAAMDHIFADERRDGTWGEIFDYNAPHDRAICAAIGVDGGDCTKALRCIMGVLDKAPSLTFLSARFVQKSQGLLAFTRFDHTCVLSLDGIYSKAGHEFYERVWDAFDEAKIPFTQHWGKSADFSRARIRLSYGDDAVDRWRTARRKLLSEASIATFANEVTASADL